MDDQQSKVLSELQNAFDKYDAEMQRILDEQRALLKKVHELVRQEKLKQAKEQLSSES